VIATYDLTTIKDIFDKVPTGRIDACMKELIVLMLQAADVRDLVNGVAGDSASFVFPDTIVWTDDDKGEVTLRVSAGGHDFLTVKTQMAKENQHRAPQGR